MGILSASVSLSIYKVKEKVEDSIFQNVLDRLRQFSFQEIENLSVERGFGWVSSEDWLDSHFASSPFKGNYLVFSLRLDTRRVSPAVLKKHYTLALQELLNQKKKEGKNFISKEEKKELKENIKLKLLSKTLPVPAVFDVSWDMLKNLVYFSSTREKVKELFVDLFVRTFEIHLIPCDPLNMALEKLPEEAMSNYSPSILV